MVAPEQAAEEIAALRRRVAELEAALTARSRQIVLLLDRLPAELYPVAERVLAGLPLAPRYAVQPEDWAESTDLVPADVEEVLADLWASTAPPPRGRRS